MAASLEEPDAEVPDDWVSLDVPDEHAAKATNGTATNKARRRIRNPQVSTIGIAHRRLAPEHNPSPYAPELFAGCA